MNAMDLMHDLRAALMAARKTFKLEGEVQPLDQISMVQATEALRACGDLTDREAKIVREFLALGDGYQQEEEVQRVIDDLNAIALARTKA